MSQKRIRKQLEQISKDPPKNCVSAGPKDEANISQWQASFYGPEGSPFEEGLFFLDITFPQQYPFKPPKCKFRTKIYHPNINQRGEISMGHQPNERMCLGCSHGWSPALTIAHAIKEIMNILKEPNPDDPLVPQIAKEYKNDKKSYEQKAREWTKKYSSD